MYNLSDKNFQALVIGCLPVEGEFGTFFNIAFRTVEPIDVGDGETASIFSVASKQKMPDQLVGHNVQVDGVALYAAVNKEGETIRHKDGTACINGSILPEATIKDLGVPGFRFVTDEPAAKEPAAEAAKA